MKQPTGEIVGMINSPERAEQVWGGRKEERKAGRYEGRKEKRKAGREGRKEGEGKKEGTKEGEGRKVGTKEGWKEMEVRRGCKEGMEDRMDG